MGEIISGVYGVVSAHGVYVNGHFLPGSMTYFRGAFQVCDWNPIVRRH